MVWFIGDNFAARTFRKYFSHRTKRYEDEVIPESFVKTNYEFDIFYISKYSSATTNMLTRIQNTVARAINKNTLLPKYIVLALEDDLITFMDYKGDGAGIADVFSKWITWITDEVPRSYNKEEKAATIKIKERGGALCLLDVSTPA